MIKFSASLDSIKIDSEGESAVRLKIPLSDIEAVIKLADETQKLLKVQIEVVEE